MNYTRIAILTVGILLVSLLLHFALNGTLFTLESVSNALFVVSMVSFLMALVVQTGAYQVFYGFQYSFRVLVSRDFYKKYPSYNDFREEKAVKVQRKGTTEFLIVSFVLLVASIVMGYMV